MNVLDFPVPRTRLPGLPGLLEGSLWRRWAERGSVFPVECFRAAARYVRLKPETSCRVVVFRPRTTAGSEDSPWGFLLHLYASPERAAEAFRKVDGRRAGKEPAPYPAFCDETHAVVGVPFPLDPELPALRDFHRPFRRRVALAGLLSGHPKAAWRVRKNMQTRLLAYKPGRRAVYRVAVTLESPDGAERSVLPLHVKVEHPATLARSYRNLLRVHESIRPDATWSVPAPLGIDEERCLIACSWELGSTFAEVGSIECAVLQATARALAGLHGLEIEPPHTESEGRPEEILSLARDLSDLLPEDETRILALGDTVAKLAEGLGNGRPAVPCHGDFHPGQVLVQYGRVVLVDFDRARHDHPASDVGSFAARMIETGRDRRFVDLFVRSYCGASRTPVTDGEVDAAVALSMFRRVSVPFRELDARWPELMRERLRRVEDAARSAR